MCVGLPLPGPGSAPSGGLTTNSRRTRVRSAKLFAVRVSKRSAPVLAPKVVKPQTKAAETPTGKLVAQRSTCTGHRLGHDPVEPDGDSKREVATKNTTDFSKIPVFAADRAD